MTLCERVVEAVETLGGTQKGEVPMRRHPPTGRAPPFQGGARCSQTPLLKPKLPELLRCWGDRLRDARAKCVYRRGKKKAICWPFKSPRTDSNRRPPPYHPGYPASGCNYRRLVARKRGAFEAAAFAVISRRLRPLCSTNAPYGPALVVEIDHFPRREVVSDRSSRWSNFPRTAGVPARRAPGSSCGGWAVPS